MSATSNAKAISLGIKAVPRKLRASFRTTLRDVGAYIARHLINTKLSKDGVLAARTGATKRAVFSRVEGPDSNPSAVVGIDLTFAPGARINNDGGTITAKNSRFLTIPLDAAKTSKGVARFTARDVIENPQAFGYVGTYFKSGVLFGYKQKSRKDFIEPVVPLFALKRSVTITGKHFMEQTLAETRDYALTEMSKAAGVAVGGSGGE